VQHLHGHQVLKQQIFNAVAGSTGYVRGRDVINLSKSEGIVFGEKEKNPFVFSSLRWFLGTVGALAIILLGWLGYNRFTSKNKSVSVGKSQESMGNPLVKDVPVADNLDARIDELKVMVSKNTNEVVTLLQRWLDVADDTSEFDDIDIEE